MNVPTQMLLSFLPAPVPSQVTGQLQNAYAVLANAINTKVDRTDIEAAFTVSNPPTQAEVQAIADTLVAVVAALKRK